MGCGDGKEGNGLMKEGKGNKSGKVGEEEISRTARGSRVGKIMKKWVSRNKNEFRVRKWVMNR